MLAELKRAALALALTMGPLAALAQETATPPAADAQKAPPAALKQMKLTDAQVKGFIASQPDIAAISDKIQAAGDNPDDALKKELDEIGKKHGFASFAELDDVAANISIVMAGLDPQSGNFNDPLDALKKELADVQADSSIPDAEKKQLVEELNEAINTTPPLEHKENVDVVKTHREAIEKALQ